MRAKDLADLAGTTARTIRYYHQLGLLSVPDAGTTTWRSYGFAHLTRLMRIRWLVESGVPLAEVPHMLRPPETADERDVVLEDLAAVLDSIDERLATLGAQRARVETLRERVLTQGRLSPLPESIVRMYAVMSERPLPPEMVEAMRRERDLLELASYRGAVPPDVVALVDALADTDLDEICRLWEECHRIDRVARAGLTEPLLADVVDQVLELAERAEPDATRRLLARAAELDRPVVRAAVGLAYPSPAYRELLARVVTVARERSGS